MAKALTWGERHARDIVKELSRRWGGRLGGWGALGAELREALVCKEVIRIMGGNERTDGPDSREAQYMSVWRAAVNIIEPEESA